MARLLGRVSKTNCFYSTLKREKSFRNPSGKTIKAPRTPSPQPAILYYYSIFVLLNNSYKSTWAPASYSSSLPLSALLLLPTNTATSIPTWSSSSKQWARRAATSGRDAAGCDGAAATGEKKKGKDGSNSESSHQSDTIKML
uniref:Uncharacterized protein n=1 Tax=Meloidogyne incognita TaxID=6306 RepID=A0A914N1G4_MELIC